MADRTLDRRYSAPPTEVFEAGRRAVEDLGFAVRVIDPATQKIAFNTRRPTAPGSGHDLIASVLREESGCRVVVAGSGPAHASPLAGRGQLNPWRERTEISHRFLDALSHRLLTPNEGWLEDPSGRFRERWWDGSAWTTAARDDPAGPRYQDAPGSLALPTLISSHH